MLLYSSFVSLSDNLVPVMGPLGSTCVLRFSCVKLFSRTGIYSEAMLQDKTAFEERMFDYNDPNEAHKTNKSRQ